ncbi:MAG: homoserine dehydrogenase [bacterium]|nr:homoserine dehydrogenase [bacterium]
MKTLKIAMIGFGGVGQGLAEILLDKEKELAKREGPAFRVVAISDLHKGSLANPEGIDLGQAVRTVKRGGSLDTMEGGKHGWDALTTIRESGAEVMVEATYTDLKTGEPAMGYVREALERGMHVVTTNKGPVALGARRLLELAASKGRRFLFEGTVLSGTPVLSLARKNLAGCTIRSVMGILNGTTNFILTEMEKGKSYDEALAQAQALGYAEAEPDADVEGWDALGKLVILSNLVFDADITPSDVVREGISRITRHHLEEAQRAGRRFKLIARAVKDKKGSIEAAVRPVSLRLDDPLASVAGVTNAVMFDTDLLGPVTVIGAGAGRIATGFAALADLLEIARTD